MEFMYMDESGKNILTQPNQNFYLFGGLVLNNDNVYQALNVFKTIYQTARDELKIELNLKIKTKDKAQRIQKMLDKFELHAARIFNPTKQNVRKGKLIEENPWQYYHPAKRFKMVHDIFIGIAPYVTKIIMFKVEKTPFLQYCTQNGLIPSNELLDEKMIEFVIGEYEDWLSGTKKKGTIICDRLDSSIRDSFVLKINASNHKQYWSEPVVVESHLNAFTQIIDIITYCYYMIISNATHKDNFKAIKNVYNKHIKGVLEERDLINYLQTPKINRNKIAIFFKNIKKRLINI